MKTYGLLLITLFLAFIFSSCSESRTQKAPSIRIVEKKYIPKSHNVKNEIINKQNIE